MKMFEFCQREKLLELDDHQRQAVSTMITQEVNKLAEEKGITKEDAYWRYSHGLTESSNREIQLNQHLDEILTENANSMYSLGLNQRLDEVLT